MATSDPEPASAGVVDVTTMFSRAGAASTYSSSASLRERELGKATELMLDLADLRPGSYVLDVGAGNGEQSLLAAARVGPSGRVLSTDPAPEMTELAAEAARAAGLSNIEVLVADAQDLDLDDESFDAVIARCVLMLIPDQARALREIHRVLKPDGKLSLMVWSTPERNLGGVIPSTIARRHAGLPPTSPDEAPGMFSLSRPGRLDQMLLAAGFRDVAVQRVPSTRSFPSLAEMMRFLTETFLPMRGLFSTMDEAQKSAAMAEIEETMRQFEGPDGVSAYAEVLVGVGTK